jgi:C-terminal processing protease CtpA/Prc
MLWRALAVGLVVALVSSLCACGGGGGSEDDNGFSGSWRSGVFQPADRFEAKCASPRSGSSQVTGDPFPDVKGEALDERNWLRSWTNELYLWYSEVPDRNPANYTTPDYFNLLKTTAVTASGQPKDKFHFTYATADWEAISISGTEAGYGLQWELITLEPPRRAMVAYLEPAAPTGNTASGIARGDQILSIDGVDIDTNSNSGIDTLNAGLFPATVNEAHSFAMRKPNGSTYTATLTSASVAAASVMNTRIINTGTGLVGYLQFNNHLYPAEQALITAFNTLKATNGGAGVDDLVLDMRYNGGGLLGVASEIAYMIAGPTLTAGQTFEKIQFNDKHPSTDPVTGDPLTPVQFQTTAIGYSATAGTTLPTLNLSRVFVLTGEGTCSASESVINGLRGVGVEVIQIGSTTCGKPYGFYPTDNCGTTYFSIQLKGVNAQGFGEYGDGFSPENTASAAGESVPGCSVADDFDHALGSNNESMLATALSYRLGPACPAPTGQASDGRVQSQSALATAEGGKAIMRPFWRENRILH